MWAYFDTSALLKLYIVETRHAEVRSLCDQAEVLFVSRLSWVEASSAFARRVRETPSDRPGLEQARGALVREWPGYRIVEVTPAVVERAADFTEAFALRAYDAVQLASAQELPNRSNLSRMRSDRRSNIYQAPRARCGPQRLNRLVCDHKNSCGIRYTSSQ